MKTGRTAKQTQGQEEASRFRGLYAQHGDRLYRFCFRLCGRAADAEDLTQEVFVAAYQGWERFAGRSSLLTWLYRIALYRWSRLRPHWQPEAVSWEDAPPAADVRSDPARISLPRLSLEAALLQLPDDLYDAFLLVKAEGLKYKEAAQVLDIPQGTVQWRVSEAVRRLRVLLCDAPEEEGQTEESQTEERRFGDAV